MKRKIGIASIVLFIAIIICASAVRAYRNKGTQNQVKQTEDLVIYSAHPIELLRPLIKEFESRTGLLVRVELGGTGELIERIEAEKGDPVADIIWSGSLSTLKPQMYLFEDYISKNEEYIYDDFRNEEGVLTRFSDIPSILMVNTDLIGDIEINGYEDLLNPLLKGKIAYCNPLVSSSAYEHLINMLYAMGNGNPEEGWTYVKQLCENLEGNLLRSSTEVYQGVAGGSYVAGLIFEDAAAALVEDGANIEMVYMEEGVLSTPDCIAIVKNASHMDNAALFIDFATGYEVQTMLTTKLNRRSVRMDVDTPENLKPKDEMRILHINDERIYDMKKEWINKFTEIFWSINQE